MVVGRASMHLLGQVYYNTSTYIHNKEYKYVARESYRTF